MNKHISDEMLRDLFNELGELEEVDLLTVIKIMKQVGSRKDHRFDSDGQIKASRGRASAETQKLIKEQTEPPINRQLWCGLTSLQAKMLKDAGIDLGEFLALGFDSAINSE